MVVDALERAASDAAKQVWPGVRDTLQVVLLVIWSLGWLLLALVGWAFTYPPLIAAGIGIPAVSIAGFKASRAVRRRRLRRAAETSLVARAALERVRLAREMEATLGAFDLAHRDLRAALADAGAAYIELGTSVERSVDRAREQLFQLAKRDAALNRDLKELGRLERTSSVASASSGLRAEQQRVRSEADAVTAEVQQLAQRVTEVRALSAGEAPTLSRQHELGELLEELDRTTLAYREIDAAEEQRDPARLRARLAAQRVKT